MFRSLYLFGLALLSAVAGSSSFASAQDVEAAPAAPVSPSAESAPAEGAAQLDPAPTAEAAPAPDLSPGVAAASYPTEPRVEAQTAAEEPTSVGARARLAVWQTVFGAFYGIEVCTLLRCNSPRAGIGSVLLGMGTGTAVSLLATRGHGVRPSQATLYNTAPLIGSFLTYEIFAIAGRREPTAPGHRSTLMHEKAVVGSLLGGQLGSYALAFGADRLFHPTAGEVVFAESTSLWLTSLTTLAIWDARGLGDNTEVRRAHAGYLVATLGGLAGGGYLAHRYGISAPRTMVVNAGGILGGGVGLLVGFFVLGEGVVDHRHVFAWSMIGGSVGGMALTMGLTRGLDHRRDRGHGVSMGITPERGGASVQIAMRLQ